MNFIIHLTLARLLKKQIGLNLPVKVNTLALLFGSIKPDIVKPEHSVPHTIYQAKQLIEDEIQKIYHQMQQHNIGSWKFSEKIGMIQHYLADFFCHAHTDRFQGSVWKHLKYERKHNRFISICRKYKRRIKPFFRSAEECMDYLKKQHDRYIKQIPSAAKDMIYATKVCITMGLSMAASVMHHSSLEASAMEEEFAFSEYEVGAL